MSAIDVEATFAFVDLAGFTALTEAHGDAAALRTLQSFRARVADVLRPDAQLVKTIGDAVMLRFPTPDAAVVALQELLGSEVGAPPTVLAARAGAHHGCAIALDGDYYGAAVNLASRVTGLAKPGQLLVTGAVADAAQRVGSVVTHLGVPAMRHVAEAVDVYEVRVGTDADVATDPVCHMRVRVDRDAIRLDWGGRRHHFCGLPCVARFAAAPERFLHLTLN